MKFELPELKLGIKSINYGSHSIQPIYTSLLKTIDGTLNVCSKCLSFHPTLNSLNMHLESCEIPFKPIYQENDFKISRVTPLNKKQNLCLLSQIFLKNKTLYYEVEDYDFFIVYDTEIYGYFSRCKDGDRALDCFTVFPCFQGQGWGSLLINYSQIPDNTNNEIEISKINPSEAYKIKGMGKPYSRKAIMCFRKYWKYKVIGATTVRQIALKQNITIDDAIIGLELQGFDFKKWKMKGEIAIRKPRLLSNIVHRIKKDSN